MNPSLSPPDPQPENTGQPDQSEQWVENAGAVTAGAVLKAAGEYFEEAGRTLWELLRADIKEVALRLMITILLRSFVRGQPSAHVPNPWPTNLARLLCMEWSNLATNFNYCVKQGLLAPPKPYAGGVELLIVHPRLWRCGRRQKRIDAVKLLESISEAVPIEIQLLLRFPPFGIGYRSVVESQNKIGEARPSSTSAETHIPPTGDEPSSEGPPYEIHQFSPSNEPVSFGIPNVPKPAGDEIHQSKASLKDSDSSTDLKLCTSEAVKALTGKPDQALARRAAAHVAGLSTDEKKTFCLNLPWTENMEAVRKRVRAYVGKVAWENFAGQWTNCIKLDCDAIQRVLADRDGMKTEKRDATIRDEGRHLFYLARRFSALLYVWYPKPKDADDC